MTQITKDIVSWLQQWFYTKNEVDTALDDLVDTIYPVGSIYMSVNNVSPSTLFGGTWEKIQDKFLLASGTNYSNGATGGEATHQLTERELPSDVVIIKNSSTQWYGANLPNNSGWRHLAIREHYEGQTYNQPHNNMPPYLAINVWKRTA